jgi:hypothetical protein
VNKRATLVAAISNANSLAEQAVLIGQLTAFDEGLRRQAAMDRELGFANEVVARTLTPVRTHEMSTTATDWLGTVDTSGQNYHEAMVAEAAVWYQGVPDFVRAEPAELAEQARGMARRHAGKYGEKANEAAQAFLTYVGFLHSRTGASGLPQIDQTVDPHDNPSPTPMPTDTFDNFAPEVHPLNGPAESQGAQSSERAPLIQEIMGQGGGMGAPEEPNEHATGDDFSHGYSEVPPGEPGTLRTSALDDSFQDGPSVALHYAYNMDDFREMQAQASRLDPTQAASSLPQIQQVTDVHDAPAATPLPTDVMFPLVGEQAPDDDKSESPMHPEARRRAYVARLLARKPGTWSPAECREVQAYLSATSGLAKQADQWSAPHEVPGGESGVANSPETTPQAANGPYGQGLKDGQADAASGEAPTFSDASSAVSPYVKGYSEGYSGSGPAQGPQDVPASMGGDSGQAQNAQEAQQQAQVAKASKAPRLTVSAALVVEQAAKNADFVKGYRFARRWTASKHLVSVGSPEFESGLYAGITDNPAQQRAWVETHRRLARQDSMQFLKRRMVEHTKFTRRFASRHPDALIKGIYVQAATSTDLDTTGPGVSPDRGGATPINGPGTVPPLMGGTDPARPGGPAPYNGAEPFGAGPVAPDPVVGPSQDGGQASPIEPGANTQAIAFRTKVQAALKVMSKENAR